MRHQHRAAQLDCARDRVRARAGVALTSGHLARILGLSGDVGDPDASLDWICGTCASELGVSGAAVASILSGHDLGPIAASNDVAAAIMDLQFSTGERPALDALSQAMADAATIGILHERFIARREEVSEQLQLAFNTRVVLEQAKGVVAEAAKIDMDKAFALLRGYGRHHNLLLSEVARQVIDRELAADALVIQPRGRASRHR